MGLRISNHLLECTKQYIKLTEQNKLIPYIVMLIIESKFLMPSP
jgi:hypothetical protein